MSVPVHVNGKPDEVPPGTTVEALVKKVGGGGKGVAVAVNKTVVPRSAWEVVELTPGDVIEILHAAQGG